MQITRRPYTNNLNQKTNFGARVKLEGKVPKIISGKTVQESLEICGSDHVEHIISHKPKKGYTIRTVCDLFEASCQSNCKHHHDLSEQALHNLGNLIAARLPKNPLVKEKISYYKNI